MKAVVIGYASLDYALLLETPARPGWTSRIRRRAPQWPRPGGCPYYVADALRRGGLPATVLTWIGDDPMGQTYLEHCRNAGIGDTGIAISAGGQTLTSILAYQDDGECACLVDFGNVDMSVSTAQRALVATADLVCFTVGPPAAALALLEHVPTTANVAWIAKNDADSFPPALRQALGQRARWCFCNSAERPWIEDACAGRAIQPLIVQTHGDAPVEVIEGGHHMQVVVDPLSVADATGAGDTLAGTTLAALMTGAEPVAAVVAGCAAARALLSARHPAESLQRPITDRKECT